MLENIVRHIEEGMRPFDAALAGSREVGFTIVSITISLVAVFIPILLMGGVVGRIFNEFAVVVTIAIVASALVSLTLTPMLCARFPAQRGNAREHADGARAAASSRPCTRPIASRLDFCLRARPLVLARLPRARSSRTAWLFVASPKGFLPQEDIGQLSVSTEAREDISFADMLGAPEQGRRRAPGQALCRQCRLGGRRRLRLVRPPTRAACSSS